MTDIKLDQLIGEVGWQREVPYLMVDQALVEIGWQREVPYLMIDQLIIEVGWSATDPNPLRFGPKTQKMEF